LQAFCTLLKRPAKYRAAFARRRSGVRIPSAPLRKYGVLQEKPELEMRIQTPGGTLVQQPQQD
jgi:hypothetical protein